MRVYHFLNEKYGLQALRDCRLKVSRISDLNDPFELLAPRLSDPELRRGFLRTKSNLSKNRGLLCFSKNYRNPVQWSHYAERHRGLCLGFDVPDEFLMHVTYTAKRPPPDDLFSDSQSVKEDTMKKFLVTKFSHWRYESEVRFFVPLEDKDPQSGHYFFYFSDRLRLEQVIVGAESTISRSQIGELLEVQHGNVERFKVRPAFTSFRIVRNWKASVWV